LHRLIAPASAGAFSLNTSSAMANMPGGISKLSALDSGLEVDDKLQLRRLLHRKIAGLFTFEDAADFPPRARLPPPAPVLNWVRRSD
jgi:hypothetical protein